MSAKDNGGSAFPWCGDLNDCPTIQLGMTLRDYFAAKALPVVAQRFSFSRVGDATEYIAIESFESIAFDAYLMADAMLAERAK